MENANNKRGENSSTATYGRIRIPEIFTRSDRGPAPRDDRPLPTRTAVAAAVKRIEGEMSGGGRVRIAEIFTRGDAAAAPAPRNDWPLPTRSAVVAAAPVRQFQEEKVDEPTQSGFGTSNETKICGASNATEKINNVLASQEVNRTRVKELARQHSLFCSGPGRGYTDLNISRIKDFLFSVSWKY